MVFGIFSLSHSLAVGFIPLLYYILYISKRSVQIFGIDPKTASEGENQVKCRISIFLIKRCYRCERKGTGTVCESVDER